MANLTWLSFPKALGRGQVQRRAQCRASFRPRLEQLEGRSLPSILTVTSAADSGPGSLRSTIAAAHDGDSINFSSTLLGTTITLSTGEIAFDIGLNIQGLGANQLFISGSNASRIFDIGPDASLVTIANLTVMNGRAAQGGAILDDGAALTLINTRLTNNQALGAAGAVTANGGTAEGGALAILGETTTGMTVTMTNCRFVSNTAIGGTGGAGSVGSGTGGMALGGALFIDAENSAGLAVTVTATNFSQNSSTGGVGGAAMSAGRVRRDGALGLAAGFGGLGLGGALAIMASSAAGPAFHFGTDTFASNTATGGAAASGIATGAAFGGDGGAGQGGAVWLNGGASGQALFAFVTDTFSKSSALGGIGGGGATSGGGGEGGGAYGGALFYSASSAAAPVLNLVVSTFSSNTAQAGAGGMEATSSVAGPAGFGGMGGTAAGGAVDADFQNSGGGSDTFLGDSFTLNLASGGAGGAGGSNSNRLGVGGIGGFGGGAFAGAVQIINSFLAGGSRLLIAQSALNGNICRGGTGGAGGSGGLTGGLGGGTLGVAGGGLRLRNDASGVGVGSTWILSSDTIINNQCVGGNGGAGGGGTTIPSTGGNGGGASTATGGGIDDQFFGALEILHSTIFDNTAQAGLGGKGGSGLVHGTGTNGANGTSDAGGLFITSLGGTACASMDTVIQINNAQTNPNVDGTLGVC